MSLLTRIGERNPLLSISRPSFALIERFLGCGAFLLALVCAQAAQSVTVRAQLERNNIVVGDSVQLEVVVSDSSGAGITAAVPQVDGLEIRRTGSGFRLENLRRSDVLNYQITAVREGRFEIPPITVRADGRSYRTNPLTLVVRRASEAGAEMRLTASVSKRACYVLQPVDVTFQWYASTDVGRYEMTLPLLGDKDDLSLKLLAPSRQLENIQASGYQLRAGVSTEELEGTVHTVRAVAFRIYPPQAGTYAIRRATVRADVRSGYRVVRDLFGTRRVPDYKTAFAASEPIELTVKDVPEQGKPAEFAGAVGKFSIFVRTDDTQVKVGDPILLKVAISGDGLLDKLKRPDLSQQPAFSKNFLITDSLAPGTVSGNEVTFEQTVRAKSEDVKEIPGVALAYFDPEKEAYEVAQSRPIPIRVLPTTEVTAEDVVNFGGELPVATTRLEEVTEGILANYNHLDALHNQAIRWSFLSFLAFPPAAYLIVLAIVSRRRKLVGDIAFARSKSASRVLKKYLSEARSQIEGGDRRFYDALARGISRFTSDKLNLGTGELTAYDVESLAEQHKIDNEISRELADLLVACDAGRFAPSAQSVEDRRELFRRAEELAKALGKKL